MCRVCQEYPFGIQLAVFMRLNPPRFIKFRFSAGQDFKKSKREERDVCKNINREIEKNKTKL